MRCTTGAPVGAEQRDGAEGPWAPDAEWRRIVATVSVAAGESQGAGEG